VVNARFEVGGEGDVQDASSRNWVQRLLTRHLTVW
jgi:flagellar L-ring protein precursor FlgH